MHDIEHMPTYSHIRHDNSVTLRLSVVVRGIQLVFIAISSVSKWIFLTLFARFHFTPVSGDITGRVLVSMLEQMGPIFVKLGQVLSSRPDLIGDNVARPLARLRDHISPVSTKTIIKIVEENCGAPLDQLFLQFIDEPIATGSIAQVHTAILKQGQKVAVKVQRPSLKQMMVQDFFILYHIGAILERIPGFRNVPFQNMVRELDVSIMSQLDFKCEANSMQKFQHNLAQRLCVRIPRLIPELCNHAVITMEYMIDLTPVDVIQLSKQTRQKVAKVGLETLYQMIFVDGFVHADLHPGNVFFRENGELVLLDFGLVTRLDDEMRELFREFFFAMVANHGHLCARIIQQTAEYLAPEFDAEAYSEAMRAMVDRFAGCRIQEFEVARFATELFDLQRRFGIRGSTAFTMTIISLLVFEGILKTLDPTMDFQREAFAFMLVLPTAPHNHKMRASVFESLRNTWHEHLDRQIEQKVYAST